MSAELLALEARPYGPEALVYLDELEGCQLGDRLADPRKAIAVAAARLCHWIDERRASVGVRRTKGQQRRGRVIGDVERIRRASTVRLHGEETRDAYLVIAEAVVRMRRGRSWKRQGAEGLRALRRLAHRCLDCLSGDALEELAWLNVEAQEDGVSLLAGGVPRREEARGHGFRISRATREEWGRRLVEERRASVSVVEVRR
jgi:hypothetical protein